MVLLTDISDHCPTMLSLPNLDIYKKHPKKLHTRKLDPSNIAKINERLKETDLETLLNTQNTELSYNTYQKTISSILDEISPVKGIYYKYKQDIKRKMDDPRTYEMHNETKELVQKNSQKK